MVRSAWCRRRTARRAGEGLGCRARLEVVMATDVDMREHVQMRSMTGQVGVRDVYVGQVCRIRSGRGVIFRRRIVGRRRGRGLT